MRVPIPVSLRGFQVQEGAGITDGPHLSGNIVMRVPIPVSLRGFQVQEDAGIKD